MASRSVSHWNAEDAAFWEGRGQAIASRNLWISIPALVLAFAVWMVWSAVVVNLPFVGFGFTTLQLFWLVALPSLSGAVLRLVFPFLLPVVGGRRWTAVSTALLLAPALGIGFALRDTGTSYSTLAVLALLCGLGGGNFASSMANIDRMFPSAQKGTALDLSAGLGNLGVALVQFVVPAVVTLGLFGALGGEPQTWTRGAEIRQVWLQDAGFVWVPFIAASALAAWFGMNDVVTDRPSLAARLAVLKRRHNWIMCWLYLGTFGTFIGCSAAFPLLFQTQFPFANALAFAWLGPLIGALMRPMGGWLAERFGGARVTLWTFVALAAGVSGLLALLPFDGRGGSFHGSLAVFMLLFAAGGIGNGSVFRMIPAVFMKQRLRAAAGEPAEERARRDADTESAAVLWTASAFGACGGFLVPTSYGASISISGSAQAALAIFLVFYLACIATTWWYYARRRAPMPC